MTKKHVDIVVVGLNFGRHIVQDLSADGGNSHVRLAGVCDIDREKARSVSEEYGGVRIYDSLDDVLSDESIPAVGLFTGPGGRASLIRRIIDAGKDVMTTKPFESDPDAAQAILELARERGRTVHLNSPSPGVSEDLATVERWQEEYELGRPVGARADVWAHYREQPDGRWYDDPDTCPAAPLFRLGIYPINDVVRLLGRARRVCTFSSRLFTARPTADNAQLSVELESGALAAIYASFCVRDGDTYRNGLTLNFENGTVYRNVGPVRAASGSAAEMSVVTGADRSTRRVAESVALDCTSGHYDWEGFAAAVRKEPDAPTYVLDHVVEPLRIVKAMALSEKTGRIADVLR